MNEKCLKNLYLGKTDGAIEAKEENFQELFYDPYNKYDELMSGNEKFLVLGSKGTGKTYLANYVKKMVEKKEYVKMVGESEFTICKLNAMSREACDDELAVAVSKWFLLMQLSHLIIDNHKFAARYNFFSNVYRLRKWIEQFENDDILKVIKSMNNYSTERSYSSQLTAKRDGDIPLAAKGGLSRLISKGQTKESERKNFFELLPAFERKVFASIKAEEKFYVILDDLDEFTSNKDVKGRDNIIINLIKISKEYNLDNRGKGKYKFIVLLRTDILEDLQAKYSNLSKLNTSCAVELYWLFDNTSIKPYNHPLISMILHKIINSCPIYSEYDKEQLYNELFPEAIDNKSPLDYLLDYGFGRPRDIITFLTKAKELCPDQQSFNAHVLKEARKAYSSCFYDELLNQSAFYGKPEYVRQCLQLLSTIKTSSFMFNDIKENFINCRDSYKDIDSIDDAVRFLYKIGAIGNTWKVKKNSTKVSHYSWAYKKDATSEADFSKKFTIHYGLRKKFSM